MEQAITAPQDVRVTANPAPADSSATLCVIFSTLSILFWANLLGLLGTDAQIVLGLVQLGVIPAYHICSQNLFKNGMAFEGNIFMIFAALFGGVGGLLNTGEALCEWLGIPFSSITPGVVWLVSGIVIIASMPGARYNNKAGFLFYVFGGVGLVLMGLMVIGALPAFIKPLVAWLLFGAGICGYASFFSTMNGYKGVHIPLGKPFFK